MSTKNNDLIHYSKLGNLKKVKSFIEHDADVHTQNDLALRLASRNGHLEIVKFLVEHDAYAHAQDDHALRLASSSGYKKVVKYIKSVTSKAKELTVAEIEKLLGFKIKVVKG